MDHYVLSCCSTMDLRKGWAEEHGVNLVYAKFFLEGEAYQDDFYASISQATLFERMLSGEKSQTTQVNTEEDIEKKGRISSISASPAECPVPITLAILQKTFYWKNFRREKSK